MNTPYNSFDDYLKNKAWDLADRRHQFANYSSEREMNRAFDPFADLAGELYKQMRIFDPHFKQWDRLMMNDIVFQGNTPSMQDMPNYVKSITHDGFTNEELTRMRDKANRSDDRLEARGCPEERDGGQCKIGQRCQYIHRKRRLESLLPGRPMLPVDYYRDRTVDIFDQDEQQILNGVRVMGYIVFCEHGPLLAKATKLRFKQQIGQQVFEQLINFPDSRLLKISTRSVDNLLAWPWPNASGPQVPSCPTQFEQPVDGRSCALGAYTDLKFHVSPGTINKRGVEWTYDCSSLEGFCSGGVWDGNKLIGFHVMGGRTENVFIPWSPHIYEQLRSHTFMEGARSSAVSRLCIQCHDSFNPPATDVHRERCYRCALTGFPKPESAQRDPTSVEHLPKNESAPVEQRNLLKRPSVGMSLMDSAVSTLEGADRRLNTNATW